MSTERGNNNNKWISDNSKAIQQELQELEKLIRINKNTDLKLSIKNLRKYFKRELNNDKQKFFDSKIINSEIKSKSVWKLIKS